MHALYTINYNVSGTLAIITQPSHAQVDYSQNDDSAGLTRFLIRPATFARSAGHTDSGYRYIHKYIYMYIHTVKGAGEGLVLASVRFQASPVPCAF